jgi:hypothetical protein
MTRAFLVINGGPKGIRTPVTDVRGQCPRPLDDGTTILIQFQMSNDKFQTNSPACRQTGIPITLNSNPPSPFLSPPWGEGGVRGNSGHWSLDHYLIIGIWCL